MVQGKRYFEGTIWVDDRDFQIVKTYGKGVGELTKGASTNQHSRDSRRTASRSTANTGSRLTRMPTICCTSRTRMDQRIRMTVKYQDYKKYEGKSTIKYGDVVENPKTTTPPPATKKQ